MDAIGSSFSFEVPAASDEISDASPVPGRLDLKVLAEGARKMSREEFVAKHRVPFLVQLQELGNKPDSELTVRFPTVVMASARFRTAGVGLPPHAYPIEKRTLANAFALMVTLGRATNNDIVIPDASVSKFHASFARAAGGSWTITDWSTNGTWVDGERLPARAARPIRTGALLTVAGSIPMLFASAADVFELLESSRENAPIAASA
ncbi:FHA domain-containing protein [bacterium]|nr:FHA domain-containing protein [bacterium]